MTYLKGFVRFLTIGIVTAIPFLDLSNDGISHLHDGRIGFGAGTVIQSQQHPSIGMPNRGFIQDNDRIGRGLAATCW